jgi:hypothetical protein
MDRRRFVTTLAAAASARAPAQAPGKVSHVGFLSSARRPTDAELQRSPWILELQRLGWVEGRNLIVDRRYTDGNRELLDRYARELVEARVFFGRGESALIQRIENRIAALPGWPVTWGEGLQVLHYRPGAAYKPHHDYFDPAHSGTKAVRHRGGQRVGTLMMYLNTPERGGATTFPDVALDVAAVEGNAVFFTYDKPHASTRTLHGGAPVVEGTKWVATKWLRERELN